MSKKQSFLAFFYKGKEYRVNMYGEFEAIATVIQSVQNNGCLISNLFTKDVEEKEKKESLEPSA